MAQVGGATGAVGDPSGRDAERPAQSQATLSANIAAITAQIATFFSRAEAYAASRGAEPAETVQPALLANNAEWLGQTSLVDFLSSVGRHARVSAMLARERRVRVIDRADRQRQAPARLSAGHLLRRVHVQPAAGG